MSGRPPVPPDSAFTAVGIGFVAGPAAFLFLVLFVLEPQPPLPWFPWVAFTLSLVTFGAVSLWLGPRGGTAVLGTYAAILISYVGLALHFPRPDRAAGDAAPPSAGGLA